MDVAMKAFVVVFALSGFQKVVSFQQMKSSRICFHRSHYRLLSIGIRRVHDSTSRFASSDADIDKASLFSTRHVLSGVLDRVNRTLSYKATANSSLIEKSVQPQDTVDEIFSSVRAISSDCSVERPGMISERIDSLVSDIVSQSLQTLSSTNSMKSDLDSSVASSQSNCGSPIDYGNNPTITTTALAHSLWSYVLRPEIDSAIDATAGNGGDTVTIAKMLFPQYVVGSTNNIDTFEESETFLDTKSELIAIDIQESACQNTTERLSALLPSKLLDKNVRVLHSNHSALPLPSDPTSIALIVYNLGFLPGSKTKDSVTTSTASTIASMANAARILRNGGMLSVATYPRTNREEDTAVRAFMEGLALFSSTTQSWLEYVQNVDFDKDSETPQMLRDQLLRELREVYESDQKKKWRVTEHKKLGRLDAPILFTAVRIM